MMNLGNIGHNFLAYDGVNLSDHFVVRTFDMPILPTIDANMIEIDGKPGAWFMSRKIGTRDIIVGLGILNDTKDRKEIVRRWTDLSNMLQKEKVAKLEIGEGRYVNALLVGESLPETKGKWSIVELTFRCFDPYIYGEEHEQALKAGNNTFNVKGQVSTYPIIEITGATTTTITNQGTGDKIKVSGLSTSNKLVIDMENHICMVGDVYKPADPTISDFWTIDPGNITINVSSGSGTLKYKERYL